MMSTPAPAPFKAPGNCLSYNPMVEKLKSMEDWEERSIKTKSNMQLLGTGKWIEEASSCPTDGINAIAA